MSQTFVILSLHTRHSQLGTPLRYSLSQFFIHAQFKTLRLISSPSSCVIKRHENFFGLTDEFYISGDEQS